MTGPNPVREIEALLAKSIGLDVRSIGSSMIAIAIQTRRRKRGVHSDQEYVQLVTGSPAEFQALVEEVVVPETWFFRDRESFALLSAWAREWLPAHPYHAMRLLSAPCASGEEAYSMVMTLLDTGAAADRFSVEAMDISEVSLEKARRAFYGRNSFRGQPLDFRDSFFDNAPQGWQLKPEVARQVHFRQSNLVENDSTRKDGELDVIFCRNVLIYFGDDCRKQVMTRLERMLAPDGVLFLGHAEAGLAREFGFEPIPAPMAFAFRKSRSGKPGGTRPKVAPLKVAPRRAAPLPLPVTAPVLIAKAPALKPAGGALKKTAPAVAPRDPEKELALAQQLADRREFDRAREVCHGVLETHGPSARAYYLLALIEEALGDEPRAEDYYRKTLYIEPDHEEALIQLSLLEQKQGMVKAARLLQDRARRVRARKEPQRKI